MKAVMKSMLFKLQCLKSGNWLIVEEELRAFHNISKTNTLKVIVESGMLNQSELNHLCDLFNKYPSTFIKTSSGFMKKGAILSQVKFMRKKLDDNIKIKASGGIKNQKQALKFISAGASRLGTSASVAIVIGEEGESCSAY